MKKIKLSKREVSLMYSAIDRVIEDHRKTGTSYACIEIGGLSTSLVKKYKEFYSKNDGQIWFYISDNICENLIGKDIDWRLNLMLLFIEVCK